MVELKEKRTVMRAAEIQRALVRLASEILEANTGVDDMILVGIHTGGAFLAKRLQGVIAGMEGREPSLGTMDITLYRDDAPFLLAPKIGQTSLQEDVSGKRIVLVDDVLYTGRTIRAAMDQIMDFGRPRTIQLAVLIDRGLRELPIQPNFTGRVVPTEPEERVEVLLKEMGRRSDRAVIYEVPKTEGEAEA